MIERLTGRAVDTGQRHRVGARVEARCRALVNGGESPYVSTRKELRALLADQAA